jgi:hypothetical protein
MLVKEGAMDLFHCLADILEQAGLVKVKRGDLGPGEFLDGYGRLLVLQAKYRSVFRILNLVIRHESLCKSREGSDAFFCPAEISDRCSLNPYDAEWDGFKPQNQIDMSRETFVGELDDALKKLYIATGYLAAQIQGEEAAGSGADLSLELVRKKALKGIMEHLLWHEISDRFDLWELQGKVVGLRADWKVVLFLDRRAGKKDVSSERRTDEDEWKEIGIFPIKGFSFKK